MGDLRMLFRRWMTWRDTRCWLHKITTERVNEDVCFVQMVKWLGKGLGLRVTYVLFRRWMTWWGAGVTGDCVLLRRWMTWRGAGVKGDFCVLFRRWMTWRGAGVKGDFCVLFRRWMTWRGAGVKGDFCVLFRRWMTWRGAGVKGDFCVLFRRWMTWRGAGCWLPPISSSTWRSWLGVDPRRKWVQAHAVVSIIQYYSCVKLSKCKFWHRVRILKTLAPLSLHPSPLLPKPIFIQDRT